MMVFRNIRVISNCGCARQFSSKVKTKVIPEETMLNDIKNEKYKPRYHLGIIKPKSVALPTAFVDAVRNILEDYPLKTLIKDCESFVPHLLRRMPPVEEEEIRNTKNEIYEKVISKIGNIDIDSEQEEQQFKQKVRDKVNVILKKRIYNWVPIDYDAYKSLLYLIGRSAANYAVLTKIFSEINMRDPNFKPRSLFDFGSGVGTVTWAANQFWGKYFFEYFNVDSSADMNDLAQILLKGGRSTREMSLRGVFYRQFLPANNTSYDLVVSAYSLLELPSISTRIDTILKLWHKTKHYLVVIENGSNAGFKVINEVRDFILQIENESSKGHIFSPCPHDFNCPHFLKADNTPCNFQIGYHPLPLGLSNVEIRKELYSYVVFKKGTRDSEDPQWPRTVRETLVRSKHTICRFCTANGKIEEIIFTASKHGKILYHCGRSTKWGDMLPIKIDSVIKDDDKI